MISNSDKPKYASITNYHPPIEFVTMIQVSVGNNGCVLLAVCPQ